MSVRVTKNFTAAQMAKQLPFAAALALTQTAKDAQSEIIRDLPSKFNLRTKWHLPSNRFGIKVKPARKTRLQAEVGTDADWLELHETGGIKRPRGSNLAIPTKNVRRTKRDIIRRSQRPQALRGKRTFVLPTRGGRVLFQRKYKGKRAQLVPLYNLEPRARIRRVQPVRGPAIRAISRTLGKNFAAAIDRAINTAK